MKFIFLKIEDRLQEYLRFVVEVKTFETRNSLDEYISLNLHPDDNFVFYAKESSNSPGVAHTVFEVEDTLFLDMLGNISKHIQQDKEYDGKKNTIGLSQFRLLNYEYADLLEKTKTFIRDKDGIMREVDSSSIQHKDEG